MGASARAVTQVSLKRWEADAPMSGKECDIVKDIPLRDLSPVAVRRFLLSQRDDAKPTIEVRR